LLRDGNLVYVGITDKVFGSSSSSAKHLRSKIGYLRAYESVSEARISIGRYLDFYNRASEHPSVYVVEEKRLC
jgi:hypothetical protein